jgi:spore coat protein H
MYHPVNGLDELQYVELFNRGNSALDISKWSFTKGLKFVFPEQTTMSPGSYLVVCRNRAAFIKQYGKDIPTLGDFSGKLGHKGEKIELSNASGKAVDAVKYSDDDPWPKGPDGYSPSLERICPFAAGTDAGNWAPSQMPAMESPAGTPGRKNDSFSSHPLPLISGVEFKTPAPGQKVPVTAEVADANGVKTVTLLYRLFIAGKGETAETTISMQRIAGDEKKGTYQAAIEGQPEGILVRFRIRAVDSTGTSRTQPSPNEPRPSCSYSTFANTNTARIAFAHIITVTKLPPEVEPPARPSFLAQLFGVRASPPGGSPRFGPPVPSPARGNGAFIYIPPDGGEVQTFDHVLVRPRGGGFKVHFHGDRAFKGMTGINVIFDGLPRWVLAEWLSYELYRMAGTASLESEHVRLWQDGRLLGYHVLFEQPNKSFLARHAGDDTGNLYKLLWYGHGVIGQHEKKTNLSTGHDDLVQVIDGLNRTTGAQQWEFIQKNFNVEQFINYYAVNMCIQNWDGFFNNYFTYHDTGRTGKWQIYPWDEDKTWGDYDGASPQYDWYEMPLTFGMKGDMPPRLDRFSKANNRPGYFGGVSWWRPGGYFSGPLLANPEFRQRFLARLDEMCNTLFTEAKLFPVIDALEKRLEPEVSVRAQTGGQNTEQALRLFHDHIQSLRNQVKYRRKFILDELAKTKSASASRQSSADTTVTVSRAGSVKSYMKSGP